MLNKEDQLAFHTAAKNGEIGQLKIILDRTLPSDIDELLNSYIGNTNPLTLAIIHNRFFVVQFLLSLDTEKVDRTTDALKWRDTNCEEDPITSFTALLMCEDEVLGTHIFQRELNLEKRTSTKNHIVQETILYCLKYQMYPQLMKLMKMNYDLLGNINVHNEKWSISNDPTSHTYIPAIFTLNQSILRSVISFLKYFETTDPKGFEEYIFKRSCTTFKNMFPHTHLTHLLIALSIAFGENVLKESFGLCRYLASRPFLTGENIYASLNTYFEIFRQHAKLNKEDKAISIVALFAFFIKDISLMPIVTNQDPNSAFDFEHRFNLQYLKIRQIHSTHISQIYSLTNNLVTLSPLLFVANSMDAKKRNVLFMLFSQIMNLRFTSNENVQLFDLFRGSFSNSVIRNSLLNGQLLFQFKSILKAKPEFEDLISDDKNKLRYK